MTIHRMTTREFGENPERAKQVAQDGPVFIADGEQSTHVLLTVESYEELKNRRPRTLLDMISDWDGGDFDFDPPRMNFVAKPADFD